MIPLWSEQLKQTVLLAALQQAGSIPTSRSLGHNVNCAVVKEPDAQSDQIDPKSLSLMVITLHCFQWSVSMCLPLCRNDSSSCFATFLSFCVHIFFTEVSHFVPHIFDFLCLRSCNIKSLIWLFLWFPGGVLLVSVQGIAVNVDPVFCTWLLYQPHRGSSRQQQQVLDLLLHFLTKSVYFSSWPFMSTLKYGLPVMVYMVNL